MGHQHVISRYGKIAIAGVNGALVRFQHEKPCPLDRQIEWVARLRKHAWAEIGVGNICMGHR